MKIVSSILFIVFVLLIQTMVLSRFSILVQGDLFLLLNMYYALHFSPVSCIAMGLTSGFVQDSFSQGILGMNAFSKTVIAYVFSMISSRLMLKHPLIIMLLVGISTVLDYLMIQGLLALFGLPGWSLPWKPITFSCVLNMLLGLLGFHIADRIRTRKEYA